MQEESLVSTVYACIRIPGNSNLSVFLPVRCNTSSAVLELGLEVAVLNHNLGNSLHMPFLCGPQAWPSNGSDDELFSLCIKGKTGGFRRNPLEQSHRTHPTLLCFLDTRLRLTIKIEMCNVNE
jgi:hypothetical protein